MADDIRLNTGFPGNVKTKFLLSKGGRDAGWSLMVLWTYAGKHKPHGDLTGMPDAMIESGADWNGAPGAFIAMLLECGFLDGEAGRRKLHDWDEHQPWLVGEQDRKESAAWAGLVSRYGEAKALEILEKRKRTARRRAVDEASTQGQLPVDAPSDAPSTPFPSPLPTPSPIPYQRIVDAYNETMTNLPKVRELTTKRRTAIRARWAESKKRAKVEFWTAYFEECATDNFLNGKGPYKNGHENWKPDFDYLLREDVVTRTFEKAMDRIEQYGARA